MIIRRIENPSMQIPAIQLPAEVFNGRARGLVSCPIRFQLLVFLNVTQ